MKPDIQSELLRAHLNLEISNWDEVLAQVKIIEISENVAHHIKINLESLNKMVHL